GLCGGVLLVASTLIASPAVAPFVTAGFLHLTPDPDFGLVESLDKGQASVIGRPFSVKHLQADLTGAKMQRARGFRPAVEHIPCSRVDAGSRLIAPKACFDRHGCEVFVVIVSLRRINPLT